MDALRLRQVTGIGGLLFSREDIPGYRFPVDPVEFDCAKWPTLIYDALHYLPLG